MKYFEFLDPEFIAEDVVLGKVAVFVCILGGMSEASPAESLFPKV